MAECTENDGDPSVLVSESSLQAALKRLGDSGIHSTASGAAGLAGLMQVAIDDRLRAHHLLDATSVVLLIITEGNHGYI